MSHTSAPLRRIASIAAAGLLAPVLVLSLAACANPMDVLAKVHSEEFADRTAAEAGWVGVEMPAWIPADAGTVRNTATTDETNAVIAVEGGGRPQGCATAERVGLPFDSRYGSLGESLPATVLACGPYEVVETETGWLGWFSAREQGQTPADL
jgi:hypothetical protein